MKKEYRVIPIGVKYGFPMHSAELMVRHAEFEAEKSGVDVFDVLKERVDREVSMRAFCNENVIYTIQERSVTEWNDIYSVSSPQVDEKKKKQAEKSSKVDRSLEAIKHAKYAFAENSPNYKKLAEAEAILKNIKV